MASEEEREAIEEARRLMEEWELQMAALGAEFDGALASLEARMLRDIGVTPEAPDAE